MTLDEAFRARMTLSLSVGHLNEIRRGVIWKTLLRQGLEGSNSQIQFSAAVTTFLQNDQIHSIDWNGHDIVSCFQTATSLALLEAKEDASYAKDTVVTVDVDHFKEALNRTYAFRAYLQSIDGLNDSQRAQQTRLRNDFASGARADPNLPNSFGHGHMPPPHIRPMSTAHGIGMGTMTMPNKGSQLPISSAEMSLCNPSPNRVEWQEFKDSAEAANQELFRKTKFHAIDVLVGEPCIIFKAGSNHTTKRKALWRDGDTHGRPYPEDRRLECDVSTCAAGQVPLPERIRINSLAIRKAFESIHDEVFDFGRPFLVFRPFRSLLHYEQDFREWILRQEAIVKCKTLLLH